MLIYRSVNNTKQYVVFFFKYWTFKESGFTLVSLFEMHIDHEGWYVKVIHAEEPKRSYLTQNWEK